MAGGHLYTVAIDAIPPWELGLTPDAVGYGVGLLGVWGVLPRDVGQHDFAWANPEGTPDVQVRGNYLLHVQECDLIDEGVTPPGQWAEIDYLADREPRYHDCRPMSPDHLTVVMEFPYSADSDTLIEGGQSSFLIVQTRVRFVTMRLIVTGRWPGYFPTAERPQRYHRAGEHFEMENQERESNSDSRT